MSGLSDFLPRFVEILFYILQGAILVRALLSWFNPSPANPIVGFIVDITEPILAPLRRVVPRIGMIDITPVVALLLLQLIQNELIKAVALVRF